MANTLGTALAGLPAPTSLRVGKVTAAGTRSASVLIAGVVVPDVPVLGSYVPLVDDVVALVRQEGAWLVLGSTAIGATDWIPYVPVWTTFTGSPSLGDGTLAGRYRFTDAITVEAELYFITGASTTYGTSFFMFSLPPVSMSTFAMNTFAPQGTAVDANTGNTYPLGGRIFSGNLVLGSPSGGLITNTGTPTPYAWAVGDRVNVQMKFEVLR